jgi:hypothetical protein
MTNESVNANELLQPKKPHSEQNPYHMAVYFTEEPVPYDHAALEFQKAYDNACGLITANLSLSTRRVFDRILEGRM